MIGRLLVSALAAACLAGCATTPRHSVQPLSWRSVATSGDRERLREWRGSFVAALNAARRAGNGAAIAAEGPLLDPDAALGQPAIPNGRYRCRVTKLGAKTAGMLDYVAYPAFDCVIGSDAGIQRFDKVSGSQRQVGLLYANDAISLVFLGTLVLGDETRALRYGQDEARDVVGYLQRIGTRRWRLVIPRPQFESVTDVMELVPAS